MHRFSVASPPRAVPRATTHGPGRALLLDVRCRRRARGVLVRAGVARGGAAAPSQGWTDAPAGAARARPRRPRSAGISPSSSGASSLPSQRAPLRAPRRRSRGRGAGERRRAATRSAGPTARRPPGRDARRAAARARAPARSRTSSWSSARRATTPPAGDWEYLVVSPDGRVEHAASSPSARAATPRRPTITSSAVGDDVTEGDTAHRVRERRGDLVSLWSWAPQRLQNPAPERDSDARRRRPSAAASRQNQERRALIPRDVPSVGRGLRSL